MRILITENAEYRDLALICHSKSQEITTANGKKTVSEIQEIFDSAFKCKSLQQQSSPYVFVARVPSVTDEKIVEKIHTFQSETGILIFWAFRRESKGLLNRLQKRIASILHR